MAQGVQHRNDVDESAHGKDRFVREVAALVWPAAIVNEQLVKHLRRGIQIGNQRTLTQDVEHAINQLGVIAVQAMSPAINDPFTSLTDGLRNMLAVARSVQISMTRMAGCA